MEGFEEISLEELKREEEKEAFFTLDSRVCNFDCPDEHGLTKTGICSISEDCSECWAKGLQIALGGGGVETYRQIFKIIKSDKLNRITFDRKGNKNEVQLVKGRKRFGKVFYKTEVSCIAETILNFIKEKSF